MTMLLALLIFVETKKQDFPVHITSITQQNSNRYHGNTKQKVILL